MKEKQTDTDTAHQEQLLDKHQAAKLLNCKPSTLDHWACKGTTHLPFVRVGNLRRYRLSDIQQFIRKNMVQF